MKVGLLLVSFLLCLNVVSIRTVHAQCELGWGEIVSTYEDHLACTGATSDHFTRTRGNVSESWNGTEEFMRWTVKPFPEDDDGYWFDHPHTTSRQVFLSFVVRYGSTWRDRFSGGSKFVMFYNTGGGNPRPTIFDKRVFDGTTLRYRTYAPDLLAGGSGIDSYSYPNHPIKFGTGEATEWFFVVMSLETDRTKVYVWDQSGTHSGLFQQSNRADASELAYWNAATWSTVRLLGYISQTYAGDANSYIDVGRIMVTQTLPSPPTGFVRSEPSGTPRPPVGIRIFQ